MTLRQAGVLIEILDEKAEDLTAQKREEAEADEIKNLASGCSSIMYFIFGIFAIGLLWTVFTD